MDKAERIYQELLHEKAAIWYISDTYGSKIMVKAPSSSIKALIKGCQIELLFGRDQNVHPNVFHTGLRIYDDPINYQVLSCVQRFVDEHISLAKIMHLDKVQIQFFNELNACQAFGDLILKNSDKHDIHALLGNAKKLYKGEFSDSLSQSLDNFQYSLGFDYTYPNKPQTIKTLVVAGQIRNWSVVQNSFTNTNETTHISITDVDEGNVLEKEILVTLGSLFGNDILKVLKYFTKPIKEN